MLKKFTFLLLCVVIAIAAEAQTEKPLAFPGADGFGKYATGGRGGRIIEVTNLNDDGAGSFRQAVTAKGSRIVIFKITGNIHLKKAINIVSQNLTIAGQSAPGEGICISGAPVNFKANNIIVRFLRFRLGDLGIAHEHSVSAIGYTNLIFDHCSFSWGSNYNALFYNNTEATVQWCIFSESLYKPKRSKSPEGFGALTGGMKASFHHNLFAHNATSNPYFGGAAHHKPTKNKEIVDFRNNVIYNWGTESTSGGEGGNFNIVNNYFKPGPATTKDKKTTILAIKNGGLFFLQENFVFSNDHVGKDNWTGVETSGQSFNKNKAEQEFQSGFVGKTQSAEDAYIDVMAKAGASLKRDDVDSRIIQSTGTGSTQDGGSYGDKKGIIDSQQTVGGWPELKSSNPKTDSDKDGIPDDWEKSKGLNIKDPSDANKKTLNKIYDNIEIYLNELVKDIIK